MTVKTSAKIGVKLNFVNGKIAGLIAGGKAKVIKSLTISI